MLNAAVTGEGTEAGYCLPLALVDQWQCEDVPAGDSCSGSFCQGSLDCADDRMGNLEVIVDDEHPGIVCFLRLMLSTSCIKRTAEIVNFHCFTW